ncbi:MAG TPA: hypothetical protein V6D33_19700 [Cyanophyceae cyanobacterium]
MTQLERLSYLLSDGNWHSTEELVQQVGHRFSATMHTAIKKHGCWIEKRKGVDRQYECRMIVNARSVI